MEVQHISSEPFPGWERFIDQLSLVRPEHALALVQVFTKQLAECNEGAFPNADPVLPITLHVLVRQWIQSLEAGTLPSRDADSTDACTQVLLQGAREINGLRESHQALAKSPLVLPPSLKTEQTLRILWFHHLEQLGLSWAPKLELGRSQRMFSELWPDIYKSGGVKLKSGEETAFLSTRYALLLALGIWHARGTVADVRELFRDATLSDSTLSSVLDAVSVKLEAVQASLCAASRYPDSIQNHFQRYPIIRIGDWSVFAPLPHLLLQSWDLRNLFDNLEFSIASIGDRGGVEFYRALGVVFESYARELLRELAILSDASFVPEFRYDGSLDSPDGFLITTTATVAFEMKCYRVPRASYDKVELSSFETWFASLLGTNERGRAPLMQGATFFKAWSSGRPDIRAKLGERPEHVRYFVLSYEDVPAFCSWKRFRKWYETKHLCEQTRVLWPQTTVLSIRELESLVAAARAHRERTGTSFDLVAVLDCYHQYREQAPDADRDPVNGFKDGLGNWVLRTQDHARDFEPAVLEHARSRLFAQALGFGFPGEV